MSLATLTYNQTAYTTTGSLTPTDAQVIQALNTASANLTMWRVTTVDSSTWNYIEFAPPVASPVASMRVLVTQNPGNNAYCLSPDTNAAAIWIGLAPDGGTLGTWNSATPYSAARWTKYWRCCVTALAESVYFVETDETLTIMFRDDSADNFYGAIVGAIIEPGVGSVEAGTGRVFGLITSGSTAISTSFHASSTAFLSHGTGSGTSHVGFWRPHASTNFDVGHKTLGNPALSATGYTLTYGNSKEVALPIYYAYTAAPYFLLGNLRQMYYTNERTNRTLLTGVGYVLGSAQTSAADAILLSNSV